MNALTSPPPHNASPLSAAPPTDAARLPPTPARMSSASRARPLAQPTVPRAFTCQCGRPVFFRNSTCLACGTPLGYAPTRMALLPLTHVAAAAAAPSPGAADSLPPDAGQPRWREYGSSDDAPQYLRCANLSSPAACNWLIEVANDPPAGEKPLCRCCRLTRTLPDLTVEGNAEPWHLVEVAKRRLVSSLIGFGLPVLSKVNEDSDRGLAFDLLRSPAAGPKVMTGHDDGVITLDIEEADDATREQRRHHLGEPYRTLLGHLRHEVGHYYWQRLVEHSEWIEPYRDVFGDERQDYAESLKQHYANGPRPDWPSHYVSAYASSHPWEDWAETWAHYLHMVDTLDTSFSFGLDSDKVDLTYERFRPQHLGLADDDADGAANDFLAFVNGWMELTGVLNELSRSMGVHDFYPFVLPIEAVRKLYFVHRVVTAAAHAPDAAGASSNPASTAAPTTTSTSPPTAAPTALAAPSAPAAPPVAAPGAGSA